MTQIKLVIGLVIAVALGVTVTLFGNHYLGLKRAAAESAIRGAVLESTTRGVAEGVDIDGFTTAYERGLLTGRDAFRVVKSEAIRHEPETASRADRVVPDSVRNAYRQRRLARERLGCPGGECTEDDNGNAPAKR